MRIICNPPDTRFPVFILLLKQFPNWSFLQTLDIRCVKRKIRIHRNINFVLRSDLVVWMYMDLDETYWNCHVCFCIDLDFSKSLSLTKWYSIILCSSLSSSMADGNVWFSARSWTLMKPTKLPHLHVTLNLPFSNCLTFVLKQNRSTEWMSGNMPRLVYLKFICGHCCSYIISIA